MKIDRDFFFDNIKIANVDLIAEKRKEQINFLFDKFEQSEFTLKQCAYILATVKHESNQTFKPIAEGYWIKENRIKKLYKYYELNNPGALITIFPNGINPPTYEGRGRIQTTHSYNYKKIGDILGLDLITNPDLLLQNDIDWEVLELGFTKGVWTGKKISDYINKDITDYYNCRRVVNGLDKADLIRSYAEEFESGMIELPNPEPRPPEIIPD